MTDELLTSAEALSVITGELFRLWEVKEEGDPRHEFCDEDSGGSHRFDSVLWEQSMDAALKALRRAIGRHPMHAGEEEGK